MSGEVHIEPAVARGRRPYREPETGSALDSALLAGVGVLLAFAVLAFGAVEEWSLLVLQAGAALLFAIWAARKMWREAPPLRRNVLLYPMAAFAALALAQWAFGLTSYRYATWLEMLRYAAYAMLFVVASQTMVKRRNGIPALWAMSLFGGAYALFALVQAFTAEPGRIFWTIEVPGSPFGTYVNRNHFAGLQELLIGAPILLALDSTRRTQARALAAGCAALMAASVAVSGSRGGMVAIAVQFAFVTAFLLGQRRRGRTVRAFAGVLVLVIAAAAWLGSTQALDRLGTLGRPADELRAAGRLRIAGDTLRMAAASPAVGWGLGTFQWNYPRFRSYGTNLLVDYAHNDYAQLAAEAGAAGTLILAWFLVVLYRKGLRHLRAAEHGGHMARLAALTGCTGLLVHSFTDFNLHIPANAALFFVLCAVAATERPSRRTERA